MEVRKRKEFKRTIGNKYMTWRRIRGERREYRSGGE